MGSFDAEESFITYRGTKVKARVNTVTAAQKEDTD